MHKRKPKWLKLLKLWKPLKIGDAAWGQTRLRIAMEMRLRPVVVERLAPTRIAA